MLPPRLDASLAPLNPVGGAPAPGGPSDARQVAFQRSLQSLVGSSMPAEVLAKMTDGNYLVKVAGTSVRMLLPAATQVGSQVALTLVATTPRPTFQVDSEQRGGQAAALVYAEAAEAETMAPRDSVTLRQSGAQAQAEARAGLPQGAAANANGVAAGAQARPLSLAAMLLGKAPLTPSAELPGFDPSAPAPSLSTAARAIASVLTQAQSGPGGLVALLGKTPLTSAPAAGAPLDTGQLVQKMQQEVGHSGLFYESHVAEWAEGKRSLPELTSEPQMQQARAGADAAARGAAGDFPAAAQMINQQLHTQEQSRVLWQGEAWPGQTMEWEVRRDQPQGRGGGDGDGADGQAATWRSGVRFQFPLLGAVSAAVVLVNGQVHIQMQAATEQAAGALRAHAGALQSALDAAGAPLSSFQIGLAPGGAADDGAGHGQ